jgi:superfamily II DNA or RNA helicase
MSGLSRNQERQMSGLNNGVVSGTETCAISMSGFLSHRGFVVPEVHIKKALGAGYKEFLNKLTTIVYNRVGPTTYVRSYSYELIGETRCILLPRTLAPKMRTLLDIKIVWPDPVPVEIKQNGELFPNQQVLLEYLVNTVYNERRLSDGTASCILNLRAGMGKTFLAAALIARLKLRTLYIVPRKPLREQAYDDLKAFLTSVERPVENTPHSIIPTVPCSGLSIIAKHGGPKKKSSIPPGDALITLCVINTALKLSPEVCKKFDLVIIDEIHEFVSESRRSVFRKLNARAMMGMSGTTENRRDKLDPVVHRELVVDNIVRADAVPGFSYDEIKFTGVVEVIAYKGPPEYTRALVNEATGMISSKLRHDQLVADPYRRKMTVEYIKRLHDEGHYIYVFGEEKDPMAPLLDDLRTLFPVDAPELEEVYKFNGDTRVDDIQDIKRTARVLLTTYGYSGTGVSIDRFTAIVFYTPRRSNMCQIIPRILRRGGDPSIVRRVIDIHDVNTTAAGQLRDRRIAYDFYGFTVEKTKRSST